MASHLVNPQACYRVFQWWIKQPQTATPLPLAAKSRHFNGVTKLVYCTRIRLCLILKTNEEMANALINQSAPESTTVFCLYRELSLTNDDESKHVLAAQAPGRLHTQTWSQAGCIYNSSLYPCLKNCRIRGIKQGQIQAWRMVLLGFQFHFLKSGRLLKRLLDTDPLLATRGQDTLPKFS